MGGVSDGRPPATDHPAASVEAAGSSSSVDGARFEPESVKAIQDAGGRIRANDFAARLQISRSAASGRLFRLERAGLIRRVRRGLYALTKAS